MKRYAFSTRKKDQMSKASTPDEINLYDTGKAFTEKSNEDLKRSNFLFALMRYPVVVRLFSFLTRWTLYLHFPVKWLIRRTIFRQFCGGESIEQCSPVLLKLERSGIGSILDYSVEGKDTEQDFDNVKNEVIRIIELASRNKYIPYTSVKLTGIIKGSILEAFGRETGRHFKKDMLLEHSVNRLRTICDAALHFNVPVYFDAEESWVQDGIDKVAEEMMRMYNKEKPIVLTTLQMYRWDRLAYLDRLLKEARSVKFSLGIKLVRGAYWEKENTRASSLHYRSPVHQLKSDTDRDFDRALDICLENIDIVLLCAGTHNEASTVYLLKKMRDLGIPNDHPHVYFSQLYGMSDHISYNLAREGYRVTKYLPYGPVRSVIPYLLRRAEENTAIAGQIGRELKLIREELARRKEQKLLK